MRRFSRPQTATCAIAGILATMLLEVPARAQARGGRGGGGGAAAEIASIEARTAGMKKIDG